ncbi:MAG: redoxin domain-containing protein [Armatimonadetes bacterium]|nr:redoxin domain-containing protein [Armatimonadota bacterium]MDE2207415.1 redoxin domain-containing protein [Armatimonadota bacterium]
MADYLKAGAVVWGISVQDVASKQKFAEKNHLNYPILADTSKSVSRAYGVLGSSGYAERVTFIINKKGRISTVDNAMRLALGSAGVVSTHGATLEEELSGTWHVSSGLPAPSFRLPAVDGKRTAECPAANARLTVVVLFSTTCPESIRAASKIASLAAANSTSGVQFVGVDPNWNETGSQVRAFTTQYGWNFPAAMDRSGHVTRALQAVATPEVWVIDRSGTVHYHGAVMGPDGAAPLADALAALAANNPITVADTRAVGCRLRMKRPRRGH